MKTPTKSRTNKRLTGLEHWIHAAESTPTERLSTVGRERIINDALRSERPQSALPALFAPARRLWLAGVLPLALAMLFVTGLERGGAVAPDSPIEPVLRVSKMGDRIQFDLQNGEKTHTMVRSTDPRRIDAPQGLEMKNGSYAERLQDGSALVFYRID